MIGGHKEKKIRERDEREGRREGGHMRRKRKKTVRGKNVNGGRWGKEKVRWRSFRPSLE